MRHTFILFFVSCLFFNANDAAALTYQRADSIKVVSLLTKGSRQPAGANLMLFYANELKGIKKPSCFGS